jgi:hypothetical protein
MRCIPVKMYTLRYMRRGIKVDLVRVTEALAAGARNYYDGLTFTNSVPRADFLGATKRVAVHPAYYSTVKCEQFDSKTAANGSRLKEEENTGLAVGKCRWTRQGDRPFEYDDTTVGERDLCQNIFSTLIFRKSNPANRILHHTLLKYREIIILIS